MRAERRAVATRKKPAAAPYQDLVSAHATERLPDHATDSVSHTQEHAEGEHDRADRATGVQRDAARAGHAQPGHDEQDGPDHRRAPRQMRVLDPGHGHPGRDRQRQVEQDQGHEDAGTDERDAEAHAAREEGAGQQATRNAPPAISAGSAAGRAGRAVRASASDIPMVG